MEEIQAASAAAGWRAFAGCTIAGLLFGGAAGAWLLGGLFATARALSQPTASSGTSVAAGLWPGLLLGAFFGALGGATLGTCFGLATARAVRTALQRGHPDLSDPGHR